MKNSSSCVLFVVSSQDPSCRVLITQLLHSDKLTFNTVSNDLALEDINRERNPTLYSLERSPEGVEAQYRTS